MRERIGRFMSHPVTESVVGVLIVASVGLVVCEATAEDPLAASRYALASDLITLVFCIELTLRWIGARTTRAFFRQYWIDVLALAPVVRPLRILRLLRLLRLVRLGVLLTRRMRKVVAALHEGVAENLLVFVVLGLVFLLGAVGMTVVESRTNPAFDTFGEAAWWSLFTLMAGEPIPGDAVARTTAGRVIAGLVMLGGFTVFAMFTGVVSAVMVARLKGRMEAKAMELDELNDHYVICGWNRSVPVIVRELQADPQTARTAIVLVAELDEEPDFPAGVARELVFLVRGDFTSTEVLRRAGVERAGAAILVADKSRERIDQDRDARTILAALTIEKINPGIFTSAELLSRDNEGHLRMAGVEDIVVGDEYMGNIIAHGARTYGLVSVLDELLTSTRGNEFYKVPVPADLVGKTVLEATAHLKEQHGSVLVAVETPEGGRRATRRINPAPGAVLQKEESLLLIAPDAPDAGKT
ncbi:MAG: potassium channel family protein [Planctomycetota bacterium]